MGRAPAPVADFGHVLAVLANVAAVLDELVGHPLADGGSARRQARDAVDDVLHEVAVEIGSMKPGSWWLKPLWSWRQTCDVRR